MHITAGITVIVTGISLVTLCEYALAQSRAPSAPVAPSSSAAVPAATVTATPDKPLQQMSAYIGSAEHFTFHADVTFDHVLPSGQKLQFSAGEDVALQRPNGIYIEWSGDLGDRQFWYNGKSVTLYDPATPFYATEAAPSDIDGMLEKVITQLNFTPPLADFFYSNPYKSVRGAIQYGFSTGDTEIDGQSCSGLAFVEKNVDWQIWIAKGPQLVPCKLLVTYKTHPAQPQFTAIFKDWDFSPRIATSIFTANVPPESQAISFEKVTAAGASNKN